MGKVWVSLAATLLAGTASAAAAQAAPAASERIAILAGSVITSADAAPAGPSVIVVEDGRIASITPGRDAPAGARVIDLGTRTVLPGLIDLHTHLTGDPGGEFWREAVEPDEWGVVVGA